MKSLEAYGISHAADLPLVTDSARITSVTALDDDRKDEMRDAVTRILTEYGLESAATGTGKIDWGRVDGARDDLSPVTSGKLDTLRDRIERTYPSLVELRIDVDDDADFSYGPGQFVGLRYDGTSRAYSLASSPNDDELALCIRRVPGGRMTDDLLSNVESGDEVTVRGPQGDFTLGDAGEKDVAFLATGTGVAPLRGMIRYLYQEGMGDGRDVWLFYGTGWEDDLAYRAEFRALERERDGFHFVPTLSRERIATTWKQETDYVQQTFLKYLADDVAPPDLDRDLRAFLHKPPKTDAPATIDPENLQVYACGISAMVNTLEDVVFSVGVPESDVYSEGFG